MFVLITHTSTSFFFSLHDALVTLYPHHRNPASWCMRSNFRCPRLHIFPSITGMSQFGLALLSRVREQAFPCGYITYFSYNKWLILFGKARIDLASIGTYKKKKSQFTNTRHQNHMKIKWEIIVPILFGSPLGAIFGGI